MNDRRPATLAALSIIAPLVFWTAVVAGAVLRGADYDHLTQAISELSVGQYASVMDAGFVAYGIITVWFALGLRRGAPEPVRVGFLLLALAGASTAALGLQWVAWAIAGGAPVTAAPADAHGLTVDPSYDVIHNVLAGCAYAFGAVGSISVGIGVRGWPSWRPYLPFFIATGAIVITLALFIEATRPVLDGLLQRALVALLQLWPAVYAVRSAAPGSPVQAPAPARG